MVNGQCEAYEVNGKWSPAYLTFLKMHRWIVCLDSPGAVFRQQGSTDPFADDRWIGSAEDPEACCPSTADQSQWSAHQAESEARPQDSAETGLCGHFLFIGPSIWNGLPLSVRHAETLSSFKSQLKTHLSSVSYSWLFQLSPACLK